MAHFAELDKNNVVLRVLVVSNDDIVDEDGVEQEQIGIGFLKSMFGFDTNWKQTSYNNNFRFRYASKGMIYDELNDAFIVPKPYDSWILNPTTMSWDAPIPIPTLTETQDNYEYIWNWDESDYQSDNTMGWVLTTRERTEYSPISDNSDTSEDTNTVTNERYIWVDPPGRLELVE